MDRLLVEGGFVERGERAARLILAGEVLVDGKRVSKAGALVARDAGGELQGRSPLVSPGGEKLAPALDTFQMKGARPRSPHLGASTARFSRCLLPPRAAPRCA